MLNRRRLIIELLNSKFRLAKGIKAIFFKRQSTMGTADSDELSANKVIETPIESPAISVPAATTDSDKTINTITDATAGVADSTEGKSARVINMSNILGLISYRIGQVKLNRTMSSQLEADVASKQGKDIDISKAAQNGVSASMSNLQTYGSKISKANVNGTDANIGSAIASNTNANKNEKVVITATLCCWDYPTSTDGVLTILQVNTINYENEILEVI